MRFAPSNLIDRSSTLPEAQFATSFNELVDVGYVLQFNEAVIEITIADSFPH